MDRKINKLKNPRSSIVFKEFGDNYLEINKNNENSYTIRLYNENTNGLWIDLKKEDLEKLTNNIIDLCNE